MFNNCLLMQIAFKCDVSNIKQYFNKQMFKTLKQH